VQSALPDLKEEADFIPSLLFMFAKDVHTLKQGGFG